MSEERAAWLAELQRLAVDFCESVALINAPSDVRPWNAEQVLWSGATGPSPSDRVLAYRPLGEGDDRVAVLGESSRGRLSRFVEAFHREPTYRAAYGVAFVRDMLVGLLQLSLPGARLDQLASPYWKRYVAPAVSELRAGSAQRYGEAVVSAVRALPAPHPATVVILPLAGVTTLAPRSLGGVTLLHASSCGADAEIGGCSMFIRRLKELQQRRQDDAQLVFAKVTITAEPGLAVQRAVHRAEQVCWLLRLLPNPGLADAGLADPPRIDLDAEDSAAFYIAATSVGTHPIPVRRSSSEPQGHLDHWRVVPRLEDPGWLRLARLIARGAGNDIEARILVGLRSLGEALADPQDGPAAFGAANAVQAMLGSPAGFERAEGDGEAPAAAADGGDRRLAALANRAARLVGEVGEIERSRQRALRVGSLRRQLMHDLDRPVLPEERANAVWLAYSVLRGLLLNEQLKGFDDLRRLGIGR